MLSPVDAFPSFFLGVPDSFGDSPLRLRRHAFLVPPPAPHGILLPHLRPVNLHLLLTIGNPGLPSPLDHAAPQQNLLRPSCPTHSGISDHFLLCFHFCSFLPIAQDLAQPSMKYTLHHGSWSPYVHHVPAPHASREDHAA